MSNDITGAGVTREQLQGLAEATPTDEVKQRPIFNKQKEKVGDLDYVDARFVMDRFDEVVGPENWSDSYRAGETGGIVGRICLWFGEDRGWVCREDVGTESSIEEVKGSYSDAFKRAAVKWGVGRDLYDNREDQSASGKQVHGGNGVSTTQTRARTGRATSWPIDPATAPWSCPDHGGVVVWPAGTSANGRSYDAFYACPAGRECDKRPPYGMKVLPVHLNPQQQEVPI